MTFLLGCFVGAAFGLLAASLCRSAKLGDQGMREAVQTSNRKVA